MKAAASLPMRRPAAKHQPASRRGTNSRPGEPVPLRIGVLSQVSGLTVETIRYYERERLLALPARSSGNYRLYSPADVERLAFIRLCRALDMSLEEIRALLSLHDSPQQDCSGANELMAAHLQQVRARIKELQGLERELLHLKQVCRQPGSADRCGVLRELGKQARQAQPGSTQPG